MDAGRELAVQSGRPVSDTRLRLMTGLSTTDVLRAKQHVEEIEPGSTGTDAHTLAAMVLSTWHSDPEYTALYGLPIELPFDAPEGKVSVTDLVKRVEPFGDASLAIERLMDAECVKEVAPNRYAAVSRVYLAPRMSAAGLAHFAQATGRFIGTIESNISGGGREKLLERAVFADHGIDASRLGEFSEFVKRQWALFADPIDNWLNSAEMVSEIDEGSTEIVETGVGVYHYVVVHPQPDEWKSKEDDTQRERSGK